MKKCLVLCLAVFIAACQSVSTSSLDKKYAMAKYKIPDSAMKQVIATMNSLEQCLNPKLKAMSVEEAHQRVYAKYNGVEDILWDEIFGSVIRDTIGDDKLEILSIDNASADYFQEKQTLLNNQTDTVDWVDCSLFKQQFEQRKEKIEKKAIKIK